MNRLLPFLLSLILLISCGKKIEINTFEQLSNETILKKIKENNPQKCSFKGKALINYEDRLFKVHFKSAINKKCDNSIQMLIFGPLNQVVMKMGYDGKNIELIEKGKNVYNDYSELFKKKRLHSFISLMNTPAIIPDSIKSKVAKNGKLFLTDSKNINYIVNDNFKVEKIYTSDFTLSYIYTGKNLLKKILYEDPNYKIKIEFLSTYN